MNLIDMKELMIYLLFKKAYKYVINIPMALLKIHLNFIIKNNQRVEQLFL